MAHPEIDRPAGRIVAEHRRGGATIDLDPAVGVRVGKIGAGETIRLGHRKSVLQHHDIANAEAVAGVGAANGDSDIARPVALLHGDTWAFLEQVFDRKRRRIPDPFLGHRGDGLRGRLRDHVG